MASFKTLKQHGLRYAVGSALRKAGDDLEYSAGRRSHDPVPFKEYQITVDDVSMVLDFGNIPITKPIWQRIEGMREPETTVIIRSLLREGDKVLELGSAFGYFTMLMSASVGDTGSVLSIEGLPEYFAILSRNIARNNAENVELMNAFIGSKADYVFFEPEATSPYSGINDYKSGKASTDDGNKISVKCINLQQMLQDKSYHPTHIFMDIEGFEVEALEQLSNAYLREHNPVIVFEHHEKFYDKEKGINYIKSLLETCGYTTRKIYDNIIAFKY